MFFFFFSELSGSKSQNQATCKVGVNIKHQIKLNRGHWKGNHEKGCCVSFFFASTYNIISDP